MEIHFQIFSQITAQAASKFGLEKRKRPIPKRDKPLFAFVSRRPTRGPAKAAIFGYSLRMAVIGLSLEALLAGYQPATMPIKKAKPKANSASQGGIEEMPRGVPSGIVPM